MESKMVDLEYTNDGFFVKFIPNTKAGEHAWRLMAEQDPHGVAGCFSMHLAQTLRQIRAAGYSVGKASRVKISDNDLLAELAA